MPERDDKWESCLAIAIVQLLFVFLGLDCGKSIALMIFGLLYWVHGVGISLIISVNGEGR